MRDPDPGGTVSSGAVFSGAVSSGDAPSGGGPSAPAPRDAPAPPGGVPSGPGSRTLERPWPFTGREQELELVRRSVAAGRPGVVVTGPAGCGKTRLAEEAVRGTGCVRAAGTPDARDIPFAAFAHLLPESVTLHRAARLLSGTRLLVVDDAHLLDDASAALVHRLAAHAPTRLIVLAADDAPAPDAVRRLWAGELLPRLALEPLPRDETAVLLAAGTGGPVAPLTAHRLHRLAHGDLRLLRELLGAVRAQGSLLPDPDTGEHTWDGPPPLTPAVREHAAAVLHRTGAAERETLDRLALAEPLPLDSGSCDLAVLERLEADGLIHVGTPGRDGHTVRLAHPLHGPALRAAAGRLRAARLARAHEDVGHALASEAAALRQRIDRADVRQTPTPVGDRLTEAGEPVPAAYAAVRAGYARLRGELRDAAAWARAGLRHTPGDGPCRLELALSTAQSGAVGETDPAAAADPAADAETGPETDRETDPETDVASARPPHPDGLRNGPGARRDGAGQAAAGRLRAARPAHAPEGTRPRCTARPHGTRPADPRPAAAWRAAARGDLDGALAALGDDSPYDAVRLGAPERAVGRLPRDGVFAQHARALARADGPALDRVAEAFTERGFLLFAAEAHAQAVRAHRDPLAARTSRTRAAALARRCQGARTPALTGLVLGELTARQRQIVTLAAAGLSNRQIAERLTLSVRTVGNHLHSAYTRLGGDRRALPCLVTPQDPEPA